MLPGYTPVNSNVVSDIRIAAGQMLQGEQIIQLAFGDNQCHHRFHII